MFNFELPTYGSFGFGGRCLERPASASCSTNLHSSLDARQVHGVEDLLILFLFVLRSGVVVCSVT